MVATMAPATATSTPTSSSAKKCPPNIRTGSVPAPVLVSPISVAHGNTMPGSDGKKGANWMRDQWVANLKKKRMNGGDGELSATTGAASASVTSMGSVPVVKAGIRAEASRATSEKSTASRAKRTSKSKSAKAAAAAAASADKDSLSLLQSSMFFNDLGCFELESPSFMRLTPTSSAILGSLSSPAQASVKTDKKWMKPLMKKRSNCFSSEFNSDAKRRTPRRPHSHSGSFDDSDTSSQHSYSSVGTPSNFNSADVARMWGPELDFPNGYVDTFLDLPTPKSAAMPSVTTPGGAYVLSTPTALAVSRRTDSYDELEQPKLIRTTSAEQEGLSHFFEQTTLSTGEDVGKPAARSKQSGFYTPRQAAARAVDDYFGKIVPSPANYSYTSGRCFQPTPRGTLRVQHHSGRDYSFDPKKPATTTSNGAHGSSAMNGSSSSEFDTLVQEYEFTDFDQELDTFYLDSIESFGGDLDLISS